MKCVQCKQEFVLAYGLPRILDEYGGSGIVYGGPLSTPQCKSCRAPAYQDSRGWHVERRREARTVFTIEARA